MARKKDAKKDAHIQFMVDPELKEDIESYAAEHNAGLGAAIRAVLRHWLRGNKGGPFLLPPDAIAEEKKRPSRRKKYHPDE